jgi:hypothetical protein
MSEPRTSGSAFAPPADKYDDEPEVSEEKKSRSQDKEVLLLGRLLRELAELTPSARLRIMDYLTHRCAEEAGQ